MAKFAKYRLKRTKLPNWALTVAALLVAVFCHAAFFALIRYQPTQALPEAQTSPGVTLLSRTSFSDDEWTNFNRWIAVHDPAQISRSDSPAGYTALLEKHRPRAVKELRPADRHELPPLAAVPAYSPLPPAPIDKLASAPLLIGTLTEPAFHPPAPVRKPVVRDGNGAPLRLASLALPTDVRAAERPTMITVWSAQGMQRQHLAESSGVAELDRAAMQAVTGEEFLSRKTIVIYWPELTPGTTGEEEP